MHMKPMIVSVCVLLSFLVLATSAEANWRYRAPVRVYRPVPGVRVVPRYVTPVVPYYAPRRVYVGPYRYFGPGTGVVVPGGFYGGSVMVRTPGLGLNVGY
jgi:hypothetical protein